MRGGGASSVMAVILPPASRPCGPVRGHDSATGTLRRGRWATMGAVDRSTTTEPAPRAPDPRPDRAGRVAGVVGLLALAAVAATLAGPWQPPLRHETSLPFSPPPTPLPTFRDAVRAAPDGPPGAGHPAVGPHLARPRARCGARRLGGLPRAPVAPAAPRPTDPGGRRTTSASRAAPRSPGPASCSRTCRRCARASRTPTSSCAGSPARRRRHRRLGAARGGRRALRACAVTRRRRPPSSRSPCSTPPRWTRRPRASCSSCTCARASAGST